MEQNNSSLPEAREPEVVSQPVSESTKPDHFLPISILVAALLISGSLVYTTRTKGGTALIENNVGTPTTTVATANVADPLPRDVILGDANAPITFIEYGDYQCPFCARFFNQAESQIRENYIKTGKVKMIYRDFAFLGVESVNAASAAECAKDQGKFWAYHDALFTAESKDNEEGNGNLNRDLFVKLAGDVGMDVNKFTQCYDAEQYASNVDATRENGDAVGVNGTPATFVNGKTIEGGAQPYSTYQALFETYLKK